MKSLVLLGDGMADFPIPELDGRTPLEAAHTPAMDEIAARGICGLFNPIPDGLPPGSDVGNLSLFGYDPRTTYTGRAPLEAAQQGIRLSVSDVAFRCNLVTLGEGRMKSFTSGHITSEEAGSLISDLNAVCRDLPVTFYPGVSYRHLAIVHAEDATVPEFLAAGCTPPHNITDQPFEPYLPGQNVGNFIRDIMSRAESLFANHAINTTRSERGEHPATTVWLWGQGRSPQLPTYRERFGIDGAVVSAVDLVKGIGVCAGLTVLAVPGATGYLDTDYEGKVRAALGALDTVDFAYLHVEAPDETAHEGKLDLKMRAIEDFDSRVVRPCLDYALKRGDVRVLVAPDHITALCTKTHAAGAVPFAVCGPGVEPNEIQTYCERTAALAGVLFPDGHELVPVMLQSDPFSATSQARCASRG